ncbi:hypothetical protein LCGC14_0388760 [marine sediment metagenome]|uniref:Uncharacterized protein n=1 Tax=marine sediment metagenome TaxID=412755 RepID=A0A0F9T609_9ZZZZ
MAKEAEIVAQINIDLKTVQLSSKRFQKGRFSGIAELITKVDGDTRQTVPAIIDNNGNETILSIDEKYPFQLYHRHIASTVEEVDPSEQFGDLVFRQETAQMLMVVTGDRKRLKLTKEEIITGIMLGMPLELGSSFLTANSLDNASIIPGDQNLDREDAWNTEYNTEFVRLKPEMIFFTFSYAIQTRVKFDCIEICA